MNWFISDRADPLAVRIADRHYNRQKPGSPQFVPPGRCMVLRTKHAVWVTSWPYAQYVKHAWAGAWINSLFRREGGNECASVMILEAVSATCWYFGRPPELGMITFVDAGKVRPKQNPGYCYLMAGFELVGKTKGGLLAFQLLPKSMPPPKRPLGNWGV